MIQNILNTDPEKRFGIDQIRSHPWYQLVTDTVFEGIIVGTDPIPVRLLELFFVGRSEHHRIRFSVRVQRRLRVAVR